MVDFYGERTIVPEGSAEEFTSQQLENMKSWIDITTSLSGIGTENKKGEILHYQIHTYSTTRHENVDEKAKRLRHYVTEVTLNKAWYAWRHDLSYTREEGEPSLKKTIGAISEHFKTVRTIREDGPRAFWDICNLETGIGSG